MNLQEDGIDLRDVSKSSIVRDEFPKLLECGNVLVDNECIQNDSSLDHWSKQHIVQYGITFFATLAAFANGMQYGWIGPTLRQLMLNETNIEMNDTDGISWIASCLKIGAIIGPFLGLFLADYCGRKVTILLAAIPLLFGWLIISVANNVYQLCLAEVISGVATQIIFSILPVYIGEIAAPEIRGTLAIFIAVQFSLGFLVENIIVPCISVTYNSAIAILVILFLIFTFSWMPESPYYYLMKNRPEKAANSLRRLTQTNYVEVKLERIKTAIEIQRAANVNIYQIFTNPVNRKAFWIVMGAASIHQFCGFMVVLLYAQILFEKAETPINANLGGSIMVVVGIIILFVSFFSVDNWGRRPLLILSSVATTVPLIMIGLYFHLKALKYENISSFNIVPIIALILFKITFGIGIGPLFFVLTSEMFNTSFKAYAFCILYSYMALTNLFTVKLFYVIAELYGEYIPFYFFAFCSLCGAAFGYFVLPETKGKTLEEIQLILKEN
ncbi:facilitated trehalose transporter Tret1-like [Chrysoperla carnea]|uniref:facilitated trehalose transporter Tret1-like n=1 Tax=Chrysoperla carnea TaxID=189513 RepID=UPI001D07E204|nr:facilitated trehalose transporter Tret1-like [Chrysoperla carnea]